MCLSLEWRVNWSFPAGTRSVKIIMKKQMKRVKQKKKFKINKTCKQNELKEEKRRRRGKKTHIAKNTLNPSIILALMALGNVFCVSNVER